MLSRARRSLNKPIAKAPQNPSRSLNQSVMGGPQKPPKLPQSFPAQMPPKTKGVAPVNPLLSGKKITPMVRTARPRPFKAAMPSAMNQGQSPLSSVLGRATKRLGGQKAKINSAIAGMSGPNNTPDDADPV